MKITILGHTVSYEENAKSGIYYLAYQIDAPEKKVFFDQAYSKGSAAFEDQDGRNYKLVLSGPEYKLIRS